MDEPISGPVVTVPVSVMRELVARENVRSLWVNLPYKSPDRFRRSILVTVRDEVPEPSFRFELLEDARAVQVATVTASEVFELLPRLKRVLEWVELDQAVSRQA